MPFSSAKAFALFDLHVSFAGPSMSSQSRYRMEGHSAPATYLTWSPDSKYLASGSFDRSVHVWNSKNGQLAGLLRGHLAAIIHVAWSSNGSQLVTTDYRFAVKVWDSTTDDLTADSFGRVSLLAESDNNAFCGMESGGRTVCDARY